MEFLKSIMLVDDNQFTNYLHKNIIQDTKIAKSIRIVHDGLEALNLIQILAEKKELPDLILLDLVMPRMDGLEFMKVFEKIKFSIKIPKVIALTAVENKSYIEKARAFAQIDEIIYKPLTELSLLKVVQKHFGMPMQ